LNDSNKLDVTGGFVRLPVKHAFNVRDLGGYPCGGGVTRWRTFVRADSLSAIDEDDINFLLEYGVDTVIDLRSADELAAEPEPALLKNKTAYHNIPLVSGNISDVTKISVQNGADFIPEFYISVLRREYRAITAALEAAAAAKKCALFHCSAGKDRTGIVAALLLGIAGVPEQDILANYEVTYTYNRQSPAMVQYAALAAQLQDQLYSRREYLERALIFISNEYGGLGNYLSQAGLPPDTVRAIREKFIERGTLR
jgi:protein-tyrosine phosphatase